MVCCNAASDHLSVIDVRSDNIVATIWAKPNAADLLGAAPNVADFDESGKLDAGIEGFLQKFIDAYAAWVERHVKG